MPNPKITINVTVTEVPAEGTFHVVGQSVFNLVGAPNEELEVVVQLKNATSVDLVYKVLPIYPGGGQLPPDLVVSSAFDNVPLAKGTWDVHNLGVVINPALAAGATPSIDVEFVVVV